ncbi:MAG: hypothetical protein WAK20_09160 [Candidatus Acidiferrum sp.]
MKLQNLFRSHLMVIGFGAALVVANATYAQEVDNTVWDEPNVTAITQAAPVQAQPTHDLSNAGDSSALNLEAMNTTSIVAREASISQWKPTEDWMVVSLLLTIVLVGLYSFVSAKRTNQI